MCADGHVKRRIIFVIYFDIKGMYMASAASLTVVDDPVLHRNDFARNSGALGTAAEFALHLKQPDFYLPPRRRRLATINLGFVLSALLPYKNTIAGGGGTERGELVMVAATES